MCPSPTLRVRPCGPPSHGSGSGWFATPFLHDSLIHYFTPVYPDANQPCRLLQCPSKLILFGEHKLQHVVSHFLEHYHQERNHQGKDNLLLIPVSALQDRNAPRAIRCRERLGGLLKYYGRVA